MASCITQQWAGYAPQARLTVTQTGENATQATLAWVLEYVAHGYPAETNTPRAYTVTINGSTPSGGSGTFNFGGITGTKTVASGSVTINKTTAAQNIAFGVNFTFNLTWSGVYAGSKSESGSISVGAKTKYTVSYNANGGTGTTPSAQTKWHDTPITLQSASGLSKTGHSFSRWNTNANGSGTSYNAGSQYSENANTTLHAQWTANNYTVTFNANGGSVSPTSRSVAYGSSTTLPTPTRTNYNFTGWNTRSDGKGTSYSAGARYTVYGNVTLYAQWTLAWLKPKIQKISVRRTGDDNTDALIAFTWETTYDVTLIRIEWSSASNSGSYTVSASGKSGNVSQTVGDSALDVNRAYSIKITVGDSNGSDYRLATLPSLRFPIDVYQQGDGIAFGKAAEKKGVAEFAFDADFNGSVTGRVFGLDRLPAVPHAANFNDTQWMIPGCYRVDSFDRAKTLKNCPSLYAGRLIVASAVGLQGDIGLYDYQYVYQEYIPFDATQPRYCRSITYSPSGSTFSEWVVIGGSVKVLWSGGHHMHSGQIISLSEPISQQSTGIQLVFSLYRNNAVEDDSINTFFVSKKEVELLPGAPHTFIMGINSGFSNIGAKYLLINDSTIAGHDTNTTSGTNSGISFQNSSYVLRYVIGV